MKQRGDFVEIEISETSIKDLLQPVSKKKCGKCSLDKELQEFSFRDKNKGTLRSECKTCQKEYYEENKDVLLEKAKEYQKEHQDKIKEYQKEYQEQHREEIKEQRKEYREEHKEEIKVYQEEYYEENKEIILE